ncbi:hypothetical protein M405DRAFT_505634, partial [Rhizopogon salebrosus TDB-379]
YWTVSLSYIASISSGCGATRKCKKEFVDHWLCFLQAATSEDRTACVELRIIEYASYWPHSSVYFERPFTVPFRHARDGMRIKDAVYFPLQRTSATRMQPVRRRWNLADQMVAADAITSVQKDRVSTLESRPRLGRGA